MPRLEDIRSHKRKGRCILVLDDQSTIELHELVASRLGLTVGRILDAADLKEIAQAESRQDCLDRAFAVLSRTDCGREEMLAKLLRAGVSRETADWCVDHLAESGYLDDARLAKQVAEAAGRQHWGPTKVKWRLRQHQIAPGMIEDVVRPLRNSGTQLAEALAAGAKDMKSLAKLPLATQRRRLAGRLTRAGFEGEIVSEAVYRLCGRQAEPE